MLKFGKYGSLEKNFPNCSIRILDNLIKAIFHRSKFLELLVWEVVEQLEQHFEQLACDASENYQQNSLMFHLEQIHQGDPILVWQLMDSLGCSKTINIH